MASTTRRTLLLCVSDIKAASASGCAVNSIFPHRSLAFRQSRIRTGPSHRPSLRYISTSRVRREAASSHSAADQDQPTKDRTRSKLFKDADEAVADIKSGSTIFSAGFGLCGTAETIITALHKRGPDSLNNLTAVSNNAGAAGAGGLSPLTQSGQITRCILSYLGSNKKLEQKYLNGQIAIELCPQGTLAERIRAGGSGIPAFYTPTGVRKSAHCILDNCTG
jgi:3-oxoacid CoA-transferase